MIINSLELKTPLGPMTSLASAEGILLLEFKSRRDLATEIEDIKVELSSEIGQSPNDHLLTLQIQLQEYFDKKRQKFTVPLKPTGTAFQLKVWGELLMVPYAETRTYLEQAKSYGDEKAIRALATANGKNKIAILIPCHRIIGSDGSLTGYGGGLDKKRYLLNLEREVAGPKDLFSTS